MVAGLFQDSATLKDKNRSNDRIFILEPMEGKSVITTTGALDKRIYTGENHLHAKIDTNGLWSLYLEHGALPQPLKQQFTTFTVCEKAVAEYYSKRNIEIKKVID